MCDCPSFPHSCCYLQTTSLPPATMAGARAAIQYQKDNMIDRQRQQINVASVKTDLGSIGIPVIPNTTHIIPVVRPFAPMVLLAETDVSIPQLVGNAAQAKAASDLLLSKHHLYVQSISVSYHFLPHDAALTRSPTDFPTVPVGMERLRVTPSPLHTAEQQAALIVAFDSVWTELGLKRTTDWALEGGRAGVGEAGRVVEANLWTEGQLASAKTPAAPIDAAQSAAQAAASL